MFLFEWWSGLSPWLRYGAAAVMLLISTVLWVGGVFWPWGWAAGVLMLLLGARSDTEKKGYHGW